jgi:hypothetical protein
MNRYSRLNLMELARLFQPGVKLELLLSNGKSPAPTDISGFPAYVLHWEHNRISLTVPEMDCIAPERLTGLAAGRLITLQTGGTSGCSQFTTKITTWDIAKKEITVALPTIMINSERRRAIRLPLSVAVTYQVLKFHSRELNHLTHKIGIGTSQDLSCYGMNLITELILPVGILLLIRFNLDQQPLIVYGTVRRVKPLNSFNTLSATGIKFIDPTPEFQATVTRIIAKSTAVFHERFLV